MKTKPALAKSREEIEFAAADFLQRRRFDNWDAAEQQKLDAWLDESEWHRVAFWRLEAALERVERVSALRAPAAEGRARTARLKFMAPVFAIAASLGLIAVLGMAAEHYLQQRPSDRVYSTALGGRAVLSFADHTQIELNTDTRLRFRMTGEERTVWLEKGEAWFRVSHDAARPFAVIAGNHRVTDLGTEFVVRRGGDGVEVALLTGRATLSTENAQTALLSPGDDAFATAGTMSIARKSQQELADEFAWRQGMLVFRNTRLADAAREFNRYNATKLVIADPSVADLKVSASLRTDDYADLLQLAGTMLKLRVDREGNAILISRASKKSKRTAP